MKRSDIVIGLVVLVALAGIFYYRAKRSDNDQKVPEVQSVEKTLEDKFKREIPDDASKAELKDTTGGDASGIATHNFENSKFSSTVLTDLPALSGTEFYQAWLVKDGKPVSLGKLKAEKGGFMVEYQSVKDLSDHGTVWITKETKFDNTPETKVLEGSF